MMKRIETHMSTAIRTFISEFRVFSFSDIWHEVSFERDPRGKVEALWQGFKRGFDRVLRSGYAYPKLGTHTQKWVQHDLER